MTYWVWQTYYDTDGEHINYARGYLDYFSGLILLPTAYNWYLLL